MHIYISFNKSPVLRSNSSQKHFCYYSIYTSLELCKDKPNQKTLIPILQCPSDDLFEIMNEENIEEMG